MDLSLDLSEALQGCGDPIQLPDKAFGLIMERSFHDLTDPAVHHVEFVQDLDSAINPGLSKHFYNTLISFSLEAAKCGVDKSTYSSKLEECRWGPDRIQLYTDMFEVKNVDLDVNVVLVNCSEGAIRSSYFTLIEEAKIGLIRQVYCSAKRYRSTIEMELGRIGTTHPHIVDAKWRLDYYIKDNFLEKVNKPTYLISLKTQVPGEEQLKNVEFACSIEQLQDLVSKLKDATKTLEKAAQT